MKKLAFAVTVMVLACYSVALAQPPGGGGGFQRMTVEERVENVLKSAKSLKLDNVKQDSVKAIFTDFYQTQQTQMDAIRNSGQRPDMQAMREASEKMAAARDARLKAVLSEDEWKQWEKKVSPNLNQRPGGGPGGRPGGPGGSNQF